MSEDINMDPRSFTIPAAAGSLPSEGRLPSFDGAVAWLNSPPLTMADVRGHVVLIDFWTYTCINWLRTLAYIRAWAEGYKDQGVVVIGMHTPEFTFEHDLENVRRAVTDMRLQYPIAVDSNYAIWNAFSNHYWPALYVVDATGHIRYHNFGEGDYDQADRVIRQLLAEAGVATSGLGPDVVSAAASTARGFEVAADWNTLASPETYLGYERTENFASPGGAELGERRVYTAPMRLRRNEWALSGDWTMELEPAVLNTAPGRIVYRFHARDVNLVMGPAARGTSVRFRVLLDGAPPSAAHGLDVDEQGYGTISYPRLHQLIRQPGPIADRQVEIEFLDAGAAAYCFTFG